MTKEIVMKETVEAVSLHVPLHLKIVFVKIAWKYTRVLPWPIFVVKASHIWILRNWFFVNIAWKFRRALLTYLS